MSDQYRKKPVVIEAVRFASPLGMTDAPFWLYSALMKPAGMLGRVWKEGDTLRIATLEGEMVAMLGDWIVCGVQGELYPVKPDIFAQTYESLASERTSDEDCAVDRVDGTQHRGNTCDETSSSCPECAALRLRLQEAEQQKDALSLDAAVSFLEALQAQHVYLHDGHGNTLGQAEFIHVVTAALAALRPPEAPQ